MSERKKKRRKKKKRQQTSSRNAKSVKDRKEAVRRDMISMKQMLPACRGSTCFGILELHGFDAEGIFSRP